MSSILRSILQKFKHREDAQNSDDTTFFKHREDAQNSDDTTFMMRNGERVLKELISSSNGKYNPYRIFSANELKLATNNYDKEKVIVDKVYQLYKGVWQDRLISIMKYRYCSSKRYVDCINNIVYASQMIHKHILQLVGCCLETEIPILVFESVQYETLADRIYGDTQFEPLLWRHRLKIAMDIANALSYLHLGFPRPIVYTDFKMSSIVFDEQNVAKLFDFSLAISIPEGETHVVADRVIGTLAHMAPEYMMAGVVNEKIDVYGFGLFLSELLSRRKTFVMFEENRVNEIIDPVIVEDMSFPGKEVQLQAFVQLIFNCVNKSPEDRPSMMDVANQLKQMYRSCM